MGQIYEILLGFTHNEPSYTHRYQYVFKHNRVFGLRFAFAKSTALHVWNEIYIWRMAIRLRPDTMDHEQALNLMSFRSSDIDHGISPRAYTKALSELVDLGLLARYSRGLYLINPWYCNCLSMKQWEYVAPRVWRLRSANMEVIDPEYYVPQYEPIL